MTPLTSRSRPVESTWTLSVRWSALLLVLATVAAYVTSFDGVMVFDDHYAIVDNDTIRDLARPGRILFPPETVGGTTEGRPMVALSLAVNHAVSGLAPWSYHAVNLGVHLLTGLFLFGLIRRTIVRFQPSNSFAPNSDPAVPIRQMASADALPLALITSALWLLHPLQTSAVTYIVQRAESLMGLCYVLTLYCFARSVDSTRARPWQVAAIAACLVGMGCKEVMATAPLAVLLYDRIFLAGSWRQIWRNRAGFHLALLSTLALLASLVLLTKSRGGTAGFGTAVPWWEYALTQCSAVVHYLRLALWPHPLVFDYGTPVVRHLSAVAPQTTLLLLLLGASGWALVRKPALGFLGVLFFLILAPSSSIIPIATQTMAEHRMYLPLAAVLLVLVLGVHRLIGRRVVWCGMVLALAAGIATVQRNLVFHSELALWADTVSHRPGNARARTNLGIALAEAGRLPEAVAQFEESLRLDSGSAATELNLCDVLTRLDRAAEAIPHGEAAVKLAPGSANAHVNLAHALARRHQTEEAVAHYSEALRLQPESPDVPGPLTTALIELGNREAARNDFGAAVTRYRQVLKLAPDHLQARNNLANALLVTGQVDEAIAHYQEILRRNPGDRLVQENLALALEAQRNRRR